MRSRRSNRRPTSMFRHQSFRYRDARDRSELLLADHPVPEHFHSRRQRDHDRDQEQQLGGRAESDRIGNLPMKASDGECGETGDQEGD